MLLPVSNYSKGMYIAVSNSIATILLFLLEQQSRVQKGTKMAHLTERIAGPADVLKPIHGTSL